MLPNLFRANGNSFLGILQQDGKFAWIEAVFWLPCPAFPHVWTVQEMHGAWAAQNGVSRPKILPAREKIVSPGQEKKGLFSDENPGLQVSFIIHLFVQCAKSPQSLPTSSEFLVPK